MSASVVREFHSAMSRSFLPVLVSLQIYEVHYLSSFISITAIKSEL